MNKGLMRISNGSVWPCRYALSLESVQSRYTKRGSCEQIRWFFRKEKTPQSLYIKRLSLRWTSVRIPHTFQLTVSGFRTQGDESKSGSYINDKGDLQKV